LHPTVAQLEEERLRLNGGDDALGQRPLALVESILRGSIGAVAVGAGGSMLQKRAASQSNQSV
jgi:hypothetical protein